MLPMIMVKVEESKHNQNGPAKELPADDNKTKTNGRRKEKKRKRKRETEGKRRGQLGI